MYKYFFSKVGGVSFPVYHFNKNGTILQAFFNEFAIFSSLWLLLEKTATQYCSMSERFFMKKRKKMPCP